MVASELIDSRVDVEQLQRAIEALHAHQKQRDTDAAENELLPGKEPAIWLNVAVKKISTERKLMPYRIPVIHPLVDPRTAGVCLITKDPQREYKDLLESNDIKFISRVIGISKLKGKFKPFEARRILLKEHGLFLADDRVIPLLPKLLGEKWFNAKKQPIPVTLTRKDLKKELEYAISSTYMNQNRGTNTSIKIGVMSHTPVQILANLKSALPHVAKHIKGGWRNIQALSIKTNSSVSLPIWSCSLTDDETGRFAANLEADPAKKRKRIDEEKEKATPAESAKPEGTPDKKKKKVDEVASSKAKKSAAVEDVEEPSAEPKKAKQKKPKAADAEPFKAKAPVLTMNVDEEPPIESGKAKQKKHKETEAEKPVAVEVHVEKEVVEKEETPKVTKIKIAKRKSIMATEEVAAPDFHVKTSAPKKSNLKATEVPKSPAKDEVKAKKEKSRKATETTKSAVEVTPFPKKEKKIAGAKEDKAGQSKVSSDDLKQKKSDAPGEKKKEKVVKLKGGKTAKETLLGKTGLKR